MRIYVFYDHKIEETKIETFENTEWVKLFIGIKFCLKIDGIDSGGGMGRVKLKEYVRRYVANWKLKLHFSVKGCQILGYIYVEILKER